MAELFTVAQLVPRLIFNMYIAFTFLVHFFPLPDGKKGILSKGFRGIKIQCYRSSPSYIPPHSPEQGATKQSEDTDHK